MKKNIFWIACLILSVMVVTGCRKKTPTDSEGDIIEMKVGSVLPEEHPSSQAVLFFKDRVSELSDGAIVVKTFFNSQLGKESEVIEMTQNGDVELLFISAAPLAQFETDLNAFVMPFIFRDLDHYHQVIDSDIMEHFNSVVENLDLHPLCYFDAGSRNFMTKSGPVQTPDDLAGMDIRVMGSEVLIAAVNEMGARANPMPQGDVYTALQTGRLDGWENNPPTALNFKMYETGCDKFAWSRHAMIPDILVINSDLYASLSDELKSALNQAAADTLTQQRRLWKEGSQAAVDQLTEAGMEFNEVQRDQFVESVQPVYERFYGEFGQEFEDVCERIKAIGQ